MAIYHNGNSGENGHQWHSNMTQSCPGLVQGVPPANLA